jgi:NitT/TauT family transport system substrate-binding protein
MLLLAVLTTACGYGSQASTAAPGQVARGTPLSAKTVRIGFLPNLTHATVLIGDAQGFLQGELRGTQATYSALNAGPSEIEALNSGSIDIGWIGPSPAVNGYVRAKGTNLRIIGGSASGGVKLVVNPAKIRTPDETKGRRIATPQLGNTQDIALLDWISKRGWQVDPLSGRGDVSIFRMDNKITLDAYKSGSIDGAWVPEPIASKLVAEGAEVLLDESEVWPGGHFATTNIIVSQKFLKEHPDVVEAVLRGSVRTNAWIGAHNEEARTVANRKMADLTGKPLSEPVIRSAWPSLRFTDDPLARTLTVQTEHAVAAGLVGEPDLSGLYDLAPLNRILRGAGQSPVDDAGLGVR